jgi:thiamine-monophosphate kinase
VGWKIVAVSVSDIAAMGARPTWMVLDLAVPGDDAWVSDFAAGLGQAARAFDVQLVGGDTTGTPGPRVAAVTMSGRAPGPLLRRAGAQPGDRVLVTGTPGLAAAGYLHPDPAPAALHALRHPEPHVAFAIAAAPLASAGMDLSDGLAADLPRLCAASGVGAQVVTARLPDHPALHGGDVPPRTLVLAGGDDFTLLLTASPSNAERLAALALHHGVALHDIGTITPSGPVRPDDGPWPTPPWRHHPPVSP